MLEQTHTHTQTPNPHLLQHPPLSSCSDRWPLGVWVNTTQQLHKRALLGSFWRGVPSQACRSAPGPAPTLADALWDPQVVDEQTLWTSSYCYVTKIQALVLTRFMSVITKIWVCDNKLSFGWSNLLNASNIHHPKQKPGWQENLAFILVWNYMHVYRLMFCLSSLELFSHGRSRMNPGFFWELSVELKWLRL